MSDDEIIERGLRAYRRTQQRLTDRQDRERLHALIERAGSGGLVLDERYGFRLQKLENAPKGWNE